MKSQCAMLGAVVVGLVGMGCTPDWATTNSAPYIMEIAGINEGRPIRSDVSNIVDEETGSTSVANDDTSVLVNIFRKNNNPDLQISAVEHVYLERYEVRYFRSDGRNQEGVDVPYRITGPLGNVRLHTAGPGEMEVEVSITIVRHQAKLEPPLRNLKGLLISDSGAWQVSGAGIITTIAEVTIHGRTVQGYAMEAKGSVQVSFADFADE